MSCGVCRCYCYYYRYSQLSTRIITFAIITKSWRQNAKSTSKYPSVQHMLDVGIRPRSSTAPISHSLAASTPTTTTPTVTYGFKVLAVLCEGIETDFETSSCAYPCA
nr:uncharacterized protein LOC113824711 [Penaeus vannamei]